MSGTHAAALFQPGVPGRCATWRVVVRCANHLSLILMAVLACACEQAAETPARKAAKPAAHLVETLPVRQQLVGISHERTGSLRARHTLKIYNQEEGQITEQPYYEGDQVKQGSLVLRLNDDLLQAELTKAEAKRRQAAQNLSRIRSLQKRNAASKDELARAQMELEVSTAERDLLGIRISHTSIRTPFDGVVSARLREPGDAVPRHTHILTLTNPDSLIIELKVSELLLAQLRTDDPVQVRIDALGRQLFPAKILRIHPDLDPNTRQGTVEVILDPIPQHARVGQFARVTLESAAVQRILVPFQVLRRDREGEFVYRLEADGRAVRQPVTSGVRITDQIEILHGLEPGQVLISRGFLGLEAGDRVQPVTSPVLLYDE